MEILECLPRPGNRLKGHFQASREGRPARDRRLGGRGRVSGDGGRWCRRRRRPPGVPRSRSSGRTSPSASPTMAGRPPPGSGSSSPREGSGESELWALGRSRTRAASRSAGSGAHSRRVGPLRHGSRALSVARAIVSGALANKPRNGGEAWVRLTWVLGLRGSASRSYFVEQIGRPIAPPGRSAGGVPAFVNRAYFESVVADFGLGGRSSLLCDGGRETAGSAWSRSATRPRTPTCLSTSAAT